MDPTAALVCVEDYITAFVSSKFILANSQSDPDLLADDVSTLGFLVIFLTCLATQLDGIAFIWTP